MRHELHMTRRALRALGVVLVPGTGMGFAVAGRAGAASVLAGAGLIAANSSLAAVSTGWSRRLGVHTLVTGYGGFALRMMGVLTAFTVATQIPALHKTLFVTAFCASLALVLFTACWTYARRSYVPDWRMAR